MRFAVLVMLAACSGAAPVVPPVVPPVTPPPPKPVTLADIEATLMGAQAWRVEATSRAEGMFEVDVVATVIATSDNRVRIDAKGTFNGVPLELRWVSDGQMTTAGKPAPAHTTEAVIVGMTRMGILHNLARLHMGGAEPDHAGGGVAEWVVATDERGDGEGKLAFGLTVAGTPSAEAGLTFERTERGPVMTAHHTAVRFEQGTFDVEETYDFELAYELPSDTFVVGGGP